RTKQSPSGGDYGTSALRTLQRPLPTHAVHDTPARNYPSTDLIPIKQDIPIGRSHNSDSATNGQLRLFCILTVAKLPQGSRATTRHVSRRGYLPPSRSPARIGNATWNSRPRNVLARTSILAVL